VQFNRLIRIILEQIDQPPPAIIQHSHDSKITFNDVLELLKQHEGYRNKVYLDSVGKKTIGIGFNMTRADASSLIKQIGGNYERLLNGEDVLTDEQILDLFKLNIKTAYSDAKKYLSNFDLLPKNIKLAVLDMSFNLGYPRLSKFVNTKKYIEAGEYDKAGDEILKSKWATQVKNRAKSLFTLFSSV
jgi:lysozyme